MTASRRNRLAQGVAASVLSVALAGCNVAPGTLTPTSRNAHLVEGPPIENIVTPFDEALDCMQGKVPTGLVFAVGQVIDATGKESYADGGSGKFVSAGAGEMVQTALFRAGVTVVNRRDANVTMLETQWGIRDLQTQVPANFYISGSINSLDFIPGGGFTATVAGIGPRYRQNRILIGLDLTMTDAFSGRIVASVPLQKQIFSSEIGGSTSRFFGDTLVYLDAGGQQREAVNYALRQMLNLATIQLLGQLLPDDQFRSCQGEIGPLFAGLDARAASNPVVVREAVAAARNNPRPAPVQQAAAAPAQQQTPAMSIEEQLAEIARQTSIYGARAIAAAEEALASDSADVAARKSAEAMQLVAVSARFLKRGAEMGLAGPAGDAAAIVVERALNVSALAEEHVAKLSGGAGAAATGAGAATAAGAHGAAAAATDEAARPSPSGAAPPVPGSAEAERVPGR